MRGKPHLASTHDIFMDWYADRGTEPQDIQYKNHRDAFTVTLTKSQYCCGCGKRMQAGERAYQALVTWGPRDYQCALRPHHLYQCIPAFEFVFTLVDDAMYTFSNFALNKAWVDTIGEPQDIRSRQDADEWAQWVGRYFDREIIPWKSFVIKQNGVVVREEQHPVEEKV